MTSLGTSVSLTADDLVCLFDRLFLQSERTVLVAGGKEPLYRSATGSEPARVIFRADYVRSALHEVAHWCLAGNYRRGLSDYGYWYCPDDRDLAQQRAFFTVEAKPQALEWCFCDAAGVPFAPSVDNLSLPVPEHELRKFSDRLKRCYQEFQESGLPERAQLFRDALLRRADDLAA